MLFWTVYVILWSQLELKNFQNYFITKKKEWGVFSTYLLKRSELRIEQSQHHEWRVRDHLQVLTFINLWRCHQVRVWSFSMTSPPQYLKWTALYSYLHYLFLSPKYTWPFLFHDLPRTDGICIMPSFCYCNSRQVTSDAYKIQGALIMLRLTFSLPWRNIPPT